MINGNFWHPWVSDAGKWQASKPRRLSMNHQYKCKSPSSVFLDLKNFSVRCSFSCVLLCAAARHILQTMSSEHIKLERMLRKKAACLFLLICWITQEKIYLHITTTVLLHQWRLKFSSIYPYNFKIFIKRSLYPTGFFLISLEVIERILFHNLLTYQNLFN